MSRTIFSPDQVLRKARSVGQYYGFIPFSKLAEARRGASTKQGYPKQLELETLDINAQTVASFLRQCRDSGILKPEEDGVPEGPIFTWHTNIAHGRTAPKNANIQFHALSADRTIADAIIIRALHALTKDLFKSEPVIRINTLGDKETRARFARELGNYFRKHGDMLSPDCINCAKKDVFAAAELLITGECAHDLPSPTDNLSDASRKRFEALLEYLEMTDTPYELAPGLISHGNAWSDACFDVVVDGQTVAWGSRYTELASHFFPESMHTVGAVLRIETTGEKVVPPKKSVRPRFVFVHIGDEAKHMSIRLAEEFKRVRIPLEQIIGIESLTDQMKHVEKMNPPYVLIMGRKEALEGSAILRNRETQENVVMSLDGLAEQLKVMA